MPVCLMHKLTMGFAVVGVINGVLMQETFKAWDRADNTKMIKKKKNRCRVQMEHNVRDLETDHDLCWMIFNAVPLYHTCGRI